MIGWSTPAPFDPPPPRTYLGQVEPDPTVHVRGSTGHLPSPTVPGETLCRVLWRRTLTDTEQARYPLCARCRALWRRALDAQAAAALTGGEGAP